MEDTIIGLKIKNLEIKIFRLWCDPHANVTIILYEVVAKTLKSMWVLKIKKCSQKMTL